MTTTISARFEKDPNSTRDFSVDWADILGRKPGVALSSVSATVAPVGLTIGATSVSGTIGTVRLSSGTLATTYELSMAGTFDNGEIDVQRLLITIRKQPTGLP